MITFDEAWTRDHIARIAAQRGVASWFDRFEPDGITCEGLRLHLDVIPVAQGCPTIAFMPGTNAYALLYGEALTALAERGFNVVGFDPRGHGRSEGRRGSYTMRELVSDFGSVVAYARDRFAGPVAAMGSSQGGIAAFYLAAAKVPIKAAVCHNLADLADPESVCLTRFPRLSRVFGPMIAGLARLAPELPVPMSAYLDLALEPVRSMGTARDVLDSDSLLVRHVRLKTLASLGSEPLERSVEEIITPVLILHAEADTIFPLAYVRRIYERLSCEKALHVYPELPHYMIVDHVDHYLDDVVRFLERVCRSGAEEK